MRGTVAKRWMINKAGEVNHMPRNAGRTEAASQSRRRRRERRQPLRIRKMARPTLGRLTSDGAGFATAAGMCTLQAGPSSTTMPRRTRHARQSTRLPKDVDRDRRALPGQRSNAAGARPRPYPRVPNSSNKPLSCATAKAPGRAETGLVAGPDFAGEGRRSKLDSAGTVLS